MIVNIFYKSLPVKSGYAVKPNLESTVYWRKKKLLKKTYEKYSQWQVVWISINFWGVFSTMKKLKIFQCNEKNFTRHNTISSPWPI